MQIVLDGARNGASECGFNVIVTNKDTGDLIQLDPIFTFQDALFVVPVLDLYKPRHRTLDQDSNMLLNAIDLALENEYDLRMTISDPQGATPEDPTFDFKVWVHRQNLC